ncbi:MAG: hypothetical protein WCD35_17810 [Mycobacteriales bacterium]
MLKARRRGLVGRAAVALASTAALVVPLVLTSAPAASAACATRTTRSISGVVYGVDNRDVNVSIGFDVQSTTGQIINVSDGCAKTGGYSAPVQEKNHFVKGEGQARASRMYDVNGVYKGVTTRTWSLNNLPSNAKSVWIEVYARAYTGSPCTTCMGNVDTHKYGFATRRQVPVGATGVMIRLPINCAYAGGSNGTITGSVKTRAGTPVKADRVYAWSSAPDSNYSVLGWGTAAIGTGSYTLGALASNQKYTLWLYRNGAVYKKTYVPVSKCASTRIDWVVAS